MTMKKSTPGIKPRSAACEDVHSTTSPLPLPIALDGFICMIRHVKPSYYTLSLHKYPDQKM